MLIFLMYRECSDKLTLKEPTIQNKEKDKYFKEESNQKKGILINYKLENIYSITHNLKDC